MGNTSDVFKIKKPWSLIKDRILDHYLTPYIAKISNTGKPLLIIDCCAGKGKFDDGKNGSPIIIAEHISSVINDKNTNKSIHAIFIEKKYSDDLLNNLAGYCNCKIIKGTFEENIDTVTELENRSNVFIYVDPYGIKSL